eukprot:403333316
MDFQQHSQDPLAIECNLYLAFQLIIHENSQQNDKIVRNHKLGKKKGRKFCNYFKQIDLYGKQVTLTYKGDDQFKTRIGASISFILLTSLIAFALYKGVILIQKSSSDIRKQTFYQNINKDYEVKVLNGFDFAFLVNDANFNDIYDPTYFSIDISMVSRRWDQNENGDGRVNKKDGTVNIGFEKCGMNGLLTDDQESVEYVGIYNYYCPTMKNYSLYGQFYSDKFRYVRIQVTQCRNTTTFNSCKSNEEIVNYIKKTAAQLSFIFVNSYFDSTSYDVPIKSYLDDTFYWSFLPGYNKKTNVYFKRNKIELSDTYLSGILNDEGLSFYQIENFRETLEQQSSTFELAQVYFRYDKQYDNNQRAIYGITDFFGDVGGFQSSLFFVGAILVSIFQERLFYASLIKRIYQLDKSQKHQQKQDQSSLQHQDSNINDSNPFGLKASKTISIAVGPLVSQTSTEGKEGSGPPDQLQKKQTMSERFQSILKKQFTGNNADKVSDKLMLLASFISQNNYITNQISRKKRHYKNISKHKKHFLYKKGENKVAGELDCISMIKMIRQMKLMTYILLSKKQKLLLKFQRKNVLDSDTSSSSDSDKEDGDAFKMLRHKNVVIRQLFTQRLKQTLQSYEAKDLNDVDQKLLRGLNEKYRFDGEENKDKILGVIKKYFLQKISKEKRKMELESGHRMFESSPRSELTEDEDLSLKRPYTMVEKPSEKLSKGKEHNRKIENINFTSFFNSKPKKQREEYKNKNNLHIELQDMGFLQEAEDSPNPMTTDRALISFKRNHSKILIKNEEEKPFSPTKQKQNENHSDLTKMNTLDQYLNKLGKVGQIVSQQTTTRQTYLNKKTTALTTPQTMSEAKGERSKRLKNTDWRDSEKFDTSICEEELEDIEKGAYGQNINDNGLNDTSFMNDSWSFNKSDRSDRQIDLNYQSTQPIIARKQSVKQQQNVKFDDSDIAQANQRGPYTLDINEKSPTKKKDILDSLVNDIIKEVPQQQQHLTVSQKPKVKKESSSSKLI